MDISQLSYLKCRSARFAFTMEAHGKCTANALYPLFQRLPHTNRKRSAGFSPPCKHGTWRRLLQARTFRCHPDSFLRHRSMPEAWVYQMRSSRWHRFTGLTPLVRCAVSCKIIIPHGLNDCYRYALVGITSYWSAFLPESDLRHPLTSQFVRK